LFVYEKLLFVDTRKFHFHIRDILAQNIYYMSKRTLLTSLVTLSIVVANAQVEPAAGKWKTWFISSGRDYRLPKPPPYRNELAIVLENQEKIDSATLFHINYWNAGSPGYRWQDMMNKLRMNDTSSNGVLAAMLLNVAIYDATVAAWDTKYAYKRPRPFEVDKRIKSYVLHPASPSYPCEVSVTAGVASTIIGHFYPKLADSVRKMAVQAMASRIAAGVSFPSDTSAGFALGKRIAEIEIEHTKTYMPKNNWDGKMPQEPGKWKGNPMFPLAGKGKTVVLDSSSEFRPGPPPDFAKDMEELKKFKPTFRSMSNAFYYAGQPEDVLTKKIFEYNIHLNPPRAARIYSIASIGMYDGFLSCWDAKYTYWGIRPDQYDTTFRPVLFFTPPFPGYPSGHAMIGAVNAEICSYFFPEYKSYFMKRAKDGAESRFQGGIHFRTDNEVGLEMGKKVGTAIVEKAKSQGIEK
jgi:membrane-associated phospholipid phosphatase